MDIEYYRKHSMKLKTAFIASIVFSILILVPVIIIMDAVLLNNKKIAIVDQVTYGKASNFHFIVKDDFNPKVFKNYSIYIPSSIKEGNVISVLKGHFGYVADVIIPINIILLLFGFILFIWNSYMISKKIKNWS